MIGLVAVLGAAACADSGPSDDALRMLDEPTPTADATPGDGDESAEPAADSAAFPRECRDVISFVRVSEIVAAPMRGASGVYQDDFPDSPRIERLVCQYGTEAADDNDDNDDAEPRDDPAVSVIVSSYVDPAAAAAQVELTVDNARVGGRSIDELEINGHGVTSLASSDAVSYVLAVGDRTYVVTLAGDVVPPEAGQVVLLALVEELLAGPTAS
jgi:hypothetical protein